MILALHLFRTAGWYNVYIMRTNNNLLGEVLDFHYFFGFATLTFVLQRCSIAYIATLIAIVILFVSFGLSHYHKFVNTRTSNASTVD